MLWAFAVQFFIYSDCYFLKETGEERIICDDTGEGCTTSINDSSKYYYHFWVNTGL